MTTSLITSEHRIRDWLLDLLHSQWYALGVPFNVEQPPRTEEIIDPEALLWCSLEFFPTQPRLKEQALAWWSNNTQSIVLPRIRKFARAEDDPRSLIWHALDASWRRSPTTPTAPCYGQESLGELTAFCTHLEHHPRPNNGQRHQPGKAEKTNATTILRSRDLLGNDARHFILVYLLANHGSAKLRSVAEWYGQSYRNISKVAQRWESAGVLTVDHGFAHLEDPLLWESLLGLRTQKVVLLNWHRLYNACIRLLRALEKAQAKSLPADGPVISGLVREATEQLTASIESKPSTDSPTIQNLKLLLSNI
jgi:hypothetical protein